MKQLSCYCFYLSVGIFLCFSPQPNNVLPFPFYWKITSRTLHISWDDAGCLCPVGDLFNYAAPDVEVYAEDKPSLKCNSTIEQPGAEQLESYSQRLTDGGYEEDTTSYCFYARKNNKKGEQVIAIFCRLYISFSF